jgi:hypothetical protein
VLPLENMASLLQRTTITDKKGIGHVRKSHSSQTWKVQGGCEPGSRSQLPCMCSCIPVSILPPPSSQGYKYPPTPSFFLFFFFLLHTYLVWVTAIMKAVHHSLVPALHIAAEQAVQWLSGHRQAYSLAPPHSCGHSFHQSSSQWHELGEEKFISCFTKNTLRHHLPVPLMP